MKKPDAAPTETKVAEVQGENVDLKSQVDSTFWKIM